jgi:diacylglycerol kinase (ATP)
MRAAAIFGLGSSPHDLEPFQHDPNIQWITGLPATSSEADAILIFGGDGTIHRHLAPLVKLGRPVVVVPRGSGNDFARALKLRSVRDAIAAWRKFCERGNNLRAIDLGVITPVLPPKAPLRQPTRDSVPGTSYYFCCVGGCGLDADAGRLANSMPAWLRSHGGYVVSVLATLTRFRPINMTICVADNTGTELNPRSSRPAMLLAFANAPAYGGGMCIAPRAELEDGKLDFCLVNQVGKLRLTRLFPTVYRGRHLSVPEVDYFQSNHLRLDTATPVDVYADGEYVCQTPIEVTVSPQALSVVTG